MSLYQLAHDLNNSLGIVMGNAELLLDNPTDTKTQRRLQAIRDAATKASHLIAGALGSGLE